MSVLLQISDTHFGTEQAPVVRGPRGAGARDTQPALVVLSGDITQRATRAPVRGGAGLHGPARGARGSRIPGNHDIPLFQLGRAAVRALRPLHRRPSARPGAASSHSPDWLVVTVNTTRWYRHEDGEVSDGADRSAWRSGSRSATPAQLRVVVTHQPVLVTRPEDGHNRLHGADAALRRWAAAGADLVLGGHIHLPFVRPAARGRRRRVARALGGAGRHGGVVARARRPAQLGRICCGRRARRARALCAVERWDHAASEGRFVPGQVHTLALADA